jgi:hypothetical protein
MQPIDSFVNDSYQRGITGAPLIPVLVLLDLYNTHVFF